MILKKVKREANSKISRKTSNSPKKKLRWIQTLLMLLKHFLPEKIKSKT